MILRIDPRTTVLEEPEVFDAFKVMASADAEVGEHVFISPDTVRALAGDVAQAPGWEEQFQGMLRYAASQGWTDDAGAIRLHVERPQ